MIRKIVLFTIVCFGIFSCTKQEGEGGIASIEGVVMIQNINSLNEPCGKLYPALDEDVFIQYGDNTEVDDKTETSPTGSFRFDFLTPGNYSIFAYSDDTTDFTSENIICNKTISISNKKDNISIDTIIIYKKVDYNDGVAIVTGKIRKIEYFSGTTIEKDTLPGQKEDVYIQFANNSAILDKIETSYDGSFQFQNLVPGTYKVFAYSEQAFATDDTIAFATFTVTSTTKTITLNPIYISNF